MSPRRSASRNKLCNLGGAAGTAVLGSIVTRREQFRSNVIGKAVTSSSEQLRQRVAQITDYFMAHGFSDSAAAQAKAVLWLGKKVKRQALVMDFSDAFAVIGMILAIAGALLLLASKARPWRRSISLI